MTTDSVRPWGIGEVKGRHPQLTLTSDAPVAEVLTLLEAGLREASFKVKERSATGLRARYIDWFDLASGGINKTTVEAEAVSGAAATELVVTASTFDAGRGGPKKIARGLSVTVDALRVRGYDARTTPWRSADR